MKAMQTDVYIKINSVNLNERKTVRKEISQTKIFIEKMINDYKLGRISRKHFVICVSHKLGGINNFTYPWCSSGRRLGVNNLMWCNSVKV
jgi:hypothetical protein